MPADVATLKHTGISFHTPLRGTDVGEPLPDRSSAVSTTGCWIRVARRYAYTVIFYNAFFTLLPFYLVYIPHTAAGYYTAGPPCHTPPPYLLLPRALLYQDTDLYSLRAPPGLLLSLPPVHPTGSRITRMLLPLPWMLVSVCLPHAHWQHTTMTTPRYLAPSAAVFWVPALPWVYWAVGTTLLLATTVVQAGHAFFPDSTFACHLPAPPIPTHHGPPPLFAHRCYLLPGTCSCRAHLPTPRVGPTWAFTTPVGRVRC